MKMSDARLWTLLPALQHALSMPDTTSHHDEQPPQPQDKHAASGRAIRRPTDNILEMYTLAYTGVTCFARKHDKSLHASVLMLQSVQKYRP